MIHLDIPQSSYLQVPRSIPKKSIYGYLAPEIDTTVESIEWYATINALSSIRPVVENRKSFEEIQCLRILISDDASWNNVNLFEILKPIFKQIKYHCLIELSYRGKSKLCTCMFSPGVYNWTNNVLSPLRFTAWIYPEHISEKAALCIDTINIALREEDNIESMYKRIHTAVGIFKPVNVTKETVRLLLKDLLGKIPSSTWTGKPGDILKDCTPYKYHPYEGPNRFVGIRSESYFVLHDTEEIWHCFLTDDRLAKVISGRRYRSPEQMIDGVLTRYGR